MVHSVLRHTLVKVAHGRRRLTNDADGRKILFPNQGASCPSSNTGATFIKIKAFPRRSLATRMILDVWPPTLTSGPSMKRTSVSRPANAHMAQAPYICMLNWTPIAAEVSSTNGLARVKRLATTSATATTGSHGPSMAMAALQTGHWSGLLDRSRSVTHDMMQSW